METKTIKVIDPQICHEGIKQAARLILQGEVVAFPTETVYGLGANALDAAAVNKIFIAKGRPGDNPLIVHITKVEHVEPLAREISDKAYKAMEAFWPGPLTVIVKKSDVIPYEVTAGLDTVAVRSPSHPIARALIEVSGVPIAAPSANLSGRPSPTTPEHVKTDMIGRIPLILDGGAAQVGLESTVLDTTGDIPVILRPGAITKEMLEDIFGEVIVDAGVLKPLDNNCPVKSPGMKYKHYAPKAHVIIVRGSLFDQIDQINSIASDYIKSGKKVGILATQESYLHYKQGQVLVLGSRSVPADLGANLFSRLREFDVLAVDIIIAEGVEQKNEGLAVMNRMARAAGFNFIDV